MKTEIKRLLVVFIPWVISMLALGLFLNFVVFDYINSLRTFSDERAKHNFGDHNVFILRGTG